LLPKARLAGPAVLGCLGVAAGCMVRELPRPDSAAAPITLDYGDWETVRSRHFVVHTDAGLGAIQDLLLRFEQTHQALRESFFQQAKVEDVEVVVFGDPSEYRQVAGPNTAGMFLPGVGSRGSVLLVRHDQNRIELDRVVAHELAHRFADAVHPRLPNWMDEGIARYFESIDVRDGEFHLGRASRSSQLFSTAGGVSFAELIQLPPATLYGKEASFYYAAAWALVHHLLNGEGGSLRPRFSRLLGALEDAQRRGEKAQVAFEEVYPDVPPAELDRAIARLTGNLNRQGVDTVLVYPLQPAPPAAFARAPARADELGGLIAAVHRRRSRQAPDPVVDLQDDRHLAAFETQVSLDARYFGLLYAWMFRAPFATELEAGYGSLGPQTAARVRYHLMVGEGGDLFLSAGLGPAVTLAPEHRGLALDPQLALDVRTPSRAMIRVGMSGYLPLLGDMGSRRLVTRLTFGLAW